MEEEDTAECDELADDLLAEYFSGVSWPVLKSNEVWFGLMNKENPRCIHFISYPRHKQPALLPNLPGESVGLEDLDAWPFLSRSESMLQKRGVHRSRL